MEHGPCFVASSDLLPAFWFRSIFRRTLKVYVDISSISCSQLGNAKALPQYCTQTLCHLPRLMR